MILAFLTGLLLGIVLTLRQFPDPYHKKHRVSFWCWVYREIDEILHGEKDT